MDEEPSLEESSGPKRSGRMSLTSRMSLPRVDEHSSGGSSPVASPTAGRPAPPALLSEAVRSGLDETTRSFSAAAPSAAPARPPKAPVFSKRSTMGRRSPKLRRKGDASYVSFEVQVVDEAARRELKGGWLAAFETELKGGWLEKSLLSAIIKPLLSSLKKERGGVAPRIARVEVNGIELPLDSKKGQGFRRPAKEFAANAESGTPVVVKVWLEDKTSTSKRPSAALAEEEDDDDEPPPKR